MKNKENAIFAAAVAALEKINSEWENRRSAFARGVTVYTKELMDNIGDNTNPLPDTWDAYALELLAMNGAGWNTKRTDYRNGWTEKGWRKFVESGDPYAYNADIMENFLTPKQFKTWENTTKLDHLNPEEISLTGCRRAWERVKTAFRRAYKDAGKYTRNA